VAGGRPLRGRARHALIYNAPIPVPPSAGSLERVAELARERVEPLAECFDRLISLYDREDGDPVVRNLAAAALTHARSIQSGRAGDVDACRARFGELVAAIIRRAVITTRSTLCEACATRFASPPHSTCIVCQGPEA
jgi:hypothetical protein